jgi:hypothetical protein
MFLERELSLLNIVEGLYTGGFTGEPAYRKNQYTFFRKVVSDSSHD